MNVCEKCNKKKYISHGEYPNSNPKYCICSAVSNFENECFERYEKEWNDVFLKNVGVIDLLLKGGNYSRLDMRKYILTAAEIANDYISAQGYIRKTRKNVIDEQIENDVDVFKNHLEEIYSKKEK